MQIDAGEAASSAPPEAVSLTSRSVGVTENVETIQLCSIGDIIFKLRIRNTYNSSNDVRDILYEI